MQMLSQQRCYNTTTTATRQLKPNRRQLLPTKNHNPSLLAAQSHTLASHDDIYGLSKTNVEFIRDKLRSKCFCDYSFFQQKKSIALQQSTNFFVSLMRQTWYKNVCTLPILIPRSISGLFFHHFLLNSRRFKLKIFSKLKNFLLNSSKLLT